ncbi:hypothetical protein HPP92_002167 [Vanilla planifolia]|uniref:Uncharacterized protein n=1 Tax=Vanilla planifolia TaxID=51239 RepID=A0A835S806_VANPL|nr:hypothetical protein HPP92_002167 [Vanilla planifolia]
MGIPETGKVTETLGSPLSEESTDVKHQPDPAVSEVQEAACITPREDVLGRSSILGVEFRSPSPLHGKDANGSELAVLEAELSHSFAAEGENIARFGVAADGKEYQALHSTPEGIEPHVSLFVDGVEPSFLARGEGEKVSIFEASQAGEQPHNFSHSDEEGATVLLVGDEALISKPVVEQTKLDRGAESCASTLEVEEASSSETLVSQLGDNPQPSLVSGVIHSLVSDVNMDLVSEQLTTEAETLPSAVQSESYPSTDQENMNGPHLEPNDVASCSPILVIEPEKVGTNWIVGADAEAVGEWAGPAFASVDGSFQVAEYDIQIPGGEIDAVGDDTEEEDVPASAASDRVEVTGYEIEMAGEAVYYAGEDAENACSGDLIAEEDIGVGNRRGGRRRKRGRPSSKLQGTRFPAQKKVEEEVCFICFDGGDLVVCDRRGCPKVYHPSCVNRDESYFRSKGQWSCGWHICSDCQKSASYMCYTCTYSLCKVCVNKAGFICIRGKKGLCESCMRTVLLMETSEAAGENKGEVDFNDRSSWEYLFKDYWVELKGKLSITLEELLKARSASEIRNEEPSNDAQGASSEQSAFLEENIYRKRKLNQIGRIRADEGSVEATPSERIYLSKKTSRKKRLSRNDTTDSMIQEATEISTDHYDTLLLKAKKKSRKTVNETGTHNDIEHEASVLADSSARKKTKRKSSRAAEEDWSGDATKELTAIEDIGWASKELLEFVSHMKDGDKSILSQYDVQDLLLGYVKVNNLRDPRKKSQIICDEMLQGLFGKPRVGHFEMLKLLESHFFIKDSSPISDENQGGFEDLVPVQMGGEGSNGMATKIIPDKRSKKRKRLDNEPQISPYDYAAIDVHNINLMYLRRSMMESLMDDMSTFNEKVIGSFVRIRITGSSQRQELYRLVQVVGCGKAPEGYKTGKRRTDVMLEIVNLDKKEVITVDIISNQIFTEEECKRLRQSIKFGFISRLTVGEVQEKARVLQSLRVSDLLNAPEEHTRRLNEVPDVHTDQKMDPSYESPEDERGQDEIAQVKSDRSTRSSFMRREIISPRKDGSYSSSGLQKSPILGIDPHAVSAAKRPDFASQEKNIEPMMTSIENPSPNVEAKSSAVEPKAQNEQQSEISPAKDATGFVVDENEKIWHYKDPSGKIQGPFTMAQLRKWSKHFPNNLRTWRKSEQQEDSILLTDALAGNFQKDLPEWIPGFANPTEFSKVSENTAVANTIGDVACSSPSLCNVESATVQETGGTIQTKTSWDARNFSASTTLMASLDNKLSTGSNTNHGPSASVNEVNSVNPESSLQVASRPILPCEMDHNKKIVEESGTSTARSMILSLDGKVSDYGASGFPLQLKDVLASVLAKRNDPQQNANAKANVSAVMGDVALKQDLAAYLGSKVHGLDKTDKEVDRSTSSTESNTVPEAPLHDSNQKIFHNGPLDVKRTVEPSPVESLSPQRSDASTYAKHGPGALQSSYANSLTQESGTVVNPARLVNTYEQAQPQVAQPSHLLPQMVGSLNSSSMFPCVNTGAGSTSTNSTAVSADGSKPVPSPQLNNGMSTQAYQQPNMSWGIGVNEVNNPGWRMPAQYQNFSNVAAAMGNLMCATGVQAGFGTANLGWG